ncbi:MAG: aldo/keto reductase [Solirubrobacterales bacterium]
MKTVRLGQTDLTVSKLCFGVLTIGPLQENFAVSDGADLLAYGMSRGITFFDTAEAYGTYPHLREAIRDFGKRPVIATKSYAYTETMMKQSLERALDELALPFIDLFMLHEQESVHTLRGHSPALDYLVQAKERGLVRAVGLSTHTVAGVLAGADDPRIEVIHPLFNEAGMGILDGSAQTMAAAIYSAYRQGKGIYGMKALGGGNLIQRAYPSLQFVLQHPAIASVAMGMKTRAEIDLNIAWIKGKRDEALEREVGSVRRRLHIEGWCSGCGVCAEHCRSGALSVSSGIAQVDQEHCVLCGYCGAYCPDFCIKMI